MGTSTISAARSRKYRRRNPPTVAQLDIQGCGDRPVAGSGGEVLGVHPVDELPELLDDSLRAPRRRSSTVGRPRRARLLGVDRRAGPGGQGDGVGRAARDPGAVRPVAVELDLGEERAVPQSVTTTRSTLARRARRAGPSSGRGSSAAGSRPPRGRRRWPWPRAAPMKIGSSRRSPADLAQQHDRRVAGQLDPDADELHLDHRPAPYLSVLAPRV